MRAPGQKNPFPKSLADRLISLLEKWFERRSINQQPKTWPWPQLKCRYGMVNGQLMQLAEGLCLTPATKGREPDRVDEIGYLVARLTNRQISVLEAFFLLRLAPGEGEEWTEYLKRLYGVQDTSGKKSLYMRELKAALLLIQESALRKRLI